MHKSIPFIVIILIAILASACNLPVAEKETPPPSLQADNTLVETYPVDPIFQEFYDFLGGEARLGPAIAPLVQSGDLKTQYVQAAQMIYDPLAPENDRFQLAPLGIILGVDEPPVKDPGTTGSYYLNGHVILDEFVPMYEQLGKARFVGRPLTEARHNPEKNRIEQYFENLGFYRLVDEKPGTVHLLAYGAMTCQEGCRTRPPSDSIPTRKAFLPQPFSTFASNLGLDFTGLTLSGEYRGTDGEMEVIFENLVMTLDSSEEQTSAFLFQLWLPKIFSKIPQIQQTVMNQRIWLPVTVKIISGDRVVAQVEMDNPIWLPLMLRLHKVSFGEVHLKSIVQMIGIEPQPPVLPNNDSNYVFYPTQGELGHHVPVLLDEYLKRIGGIPVVGNPITGVFSLENGSFRQCFTNLCMDFSLAEGFQARPAPLGLTYLQQYPPEVGFEPKWQEQENLRLVINEGKKFVIPGDVQEIEVVVTGNGLPLAGQALVLTVKLPDGSQREFQMDPTDQQGASRFVFPEIQAKKSTIIPYQVCLPLLDGEDLCVEEDYVVWE